MSEIQTCLDFEWSKKGGRSQPFQNQTCFFVKKIILLLLHTAKDVATKEVTFIKGKTPFIPYSVFTLGTPDKSTKRHRAFSNMVLAQSGFHIFMNGSYAIISF